MFKDNVENKDPPTASDPNPRQHFDVAFQE
jgi:hypothetical protein